jgi:hypothetical protein
VRSAGDRHGRYVQVVRCAFCRWELAWGAHEAPPSIEEIAEEWVGDGLDESDTLEQLVAFLHKLAASGREPDAEGRIDGRLLPRGSDVGAVERRIRELWNARLDEANPS